MTHDNISATADIIAKKVIEMLRVENVYPKWMELNEAIKYAKTSKNTIKSWIDEGYIYGFKRSGKWIIDRESIDNWYSSENFG